MDENPPTVYIKVYEGVEDWLHELIVQGLQVVVPQLQPLQRVQVVKGVVLNGCDTDRIFLGFCHKLLLGLAQFLFIWHQLPISLLRQLLTGCFEARDSLCAPRNPEGNVKILH